MIPLRLSSAAALLLVLSSHDLAAQFSGRGAVISVTPDISGTPSGGTNVTVSLDPTVNVNPSGPAVPDAPAVHLAPTKTTTINDAAWSATSAAGLDLSRSSSPTYSARLTNVSIRAHVSPENGPLIAGAAISGGGTLPTLVRAIGPGLAPFGVTDWMSFPQLEIFRGSTVAARTNTLSSAAPAVAASVGAFPALSPVDDRALSDAALVGFPTAGTLTAHCTGENGVNGTTLLEFYDSTPEPSATSARFTNFSARARVAPGNGVMVLGFVVTGEGELRLLLRGVGDTLRFLNVADGLSDPRVELYSGTNIIASNNDWRRDDRSQSASLEEAASSVGAFRLVSVNDAALVVTLRAGAYTLHVRSANALYGGIALAEVYELR